MIYKPDFWIGMAVGVVAGVVGYKAYTENKLNFNTMMQYNPPQAKQESGEISLEELMAQKERLEDLIAEKQASASS